MANEKYNNIRGTNYSGLKGRAKKVTLTALSALTLATTMPIYPVRADDSKTYEDKPMAAIEAYDFSANPVSFERKEDVSQPIRLEIAANNEGGSSTLEGKVSLDVLQMKQDTKKKGFLYAIGSALTVLFSPFLPSQWKEHPYRTGTVTLVYVGGAALALGGGGSSSKTQTPTDTTSTDTSTSGNHHTDTTTTTTTTHTNPTTPTTIPSTPTTTQPSGHGNGD